MLFAQDYQQFKNTQLIVNFPSHPHYDIAMDLLPEFTQKTGIKVKVDQLEYQAMRAKQALELTKPKGDYDLIAYVVTSRPDYIEMDKLYPLKPFFDNPKLAMQNYNKKDLIKAYVDNIGLQGKLYGLPFGAETSILGYRSDILEKYNMQPPKNYTDLLKQACFLHNKEKNIAGITSRGASGHHLTHAFLLHLAPMGGRVLDKNMKPILNNAAGIKAAEYLKKLLECAPIGVEAFRFGEMKNAFLQGKSVFFLDSTIIAGEVSDPKKSKIINKIKWLPHPKGVKNASQTGGFGLAIPKNGRHPQAAFLLMQWLTSPEIDTRIALMGGNPSRYTTHYDKNVLQKYPHMKIFGNALKNADPDWRPIIPEWNAMNKKIGTELSKAILGQKSIPQALDDAAFALKKILAKAGYYDSK
ncbi:MAG: multiple sugar transport system substrate-binding protein [Alphaproteobacteria bacterium]|jgi:multiple sugar transport system substrate-binding protein